MHLTMCLLYVGKRVGASLSPSLEGDRNIWIRELDASVSFDGDFFVHRFSACGEGRDEDSEDCPECGAVIALNAAAPPSAPLPPMPGTGALKPPAPPRAAGTSPKAPPKSPGAPGAPKVPDRPGRPAADEIRVPVVGGRIRMPKGMELSGETAAPEAPTGPGFEEAPDISNTGNYFTSGVYNNG